MKVLCLHGYDGTPDSEKIEAIRQALDLEVIAPELSACFHCDLAMLRHIILIKKPDYIFGVSRGGALAVALSNEPGVKKICVLNAPMSNAYITVSPKFPPHAFIDITEYALKTNNALIISCMADAVVDSKSSNVLYQLCGDDNRIESVKGGHNMTLENFNKIVIPLLRGWFI